MKCYSLILLLLVGCGSGNNSSFVGIEGQAFVDGAGRQIIFNGINHVHKVPADNYLNSEDSLIFRNYQKSGFNFIRLGVYWNTLQPQAGVINEQYLKELDKRIKWAQESALMVMLDLHQDLYLEAAPQWAVLNDGAPHIKGEVWSDSYMISPAVQLAFDSFWANRTVGNGKGVQDYYLSMLRTLAQRYKDNPTIVGYDVMNEPFPGTPANEVMPLMMSSYATAIGSNEPLEKIGELWSSVSSRIKILETLNDKQIYAQITAGMASAVDKFEQGALSDFYQRARDSIRSTGSRQIIFLEHSYFGNLGVESTFRVPCDADGRRDSLCAYAPHGYDLVTDTGGDNNPGTERVDYIFSEIFASGAKRAMPVLIGEWGAYYGGDNDYTEPAQHIVGLIEAASAGQSYWAYWPGVDTENYYKTVLSRIYPMAVNGRLKSYQNNFETDTFTATWSEGDGLANTVIYLPTPDKCKVFELTPKSRYTIKGNYLEIEPKKNCERKITIIR